MITATVQGTATRRKELCDIRIHKSVTITKPHHFNRAACLSTSKNSIKMHI